MLVAGGTGASSQCFCGVSWGAAAVGFPPYVVRLSGLSLHDSSDAVVGYRNGRVVPDVGCFFCCLMYFHALILEFRS